MNFFSWFFASDGYMPHGYCYLWQPAVLWLNVGSDVVIAISYFVIPAIIAFYLRHRRSEVRDAWIPILFASFILLCGITHAFDVWTVWHPDFRLSGLLKAAAALVSAGTALSLIIVMPRALSLQTPQQLAREVSQRTAELEQTAARLAAEITARTASEEALRESEERLRDHHRRKDEFLATLAHELRNPLAPLQNGIVLLGQPLAPAQAGSLHQMMQRQVALMVRLIDDLLDVSRITNGRLQIQWQPVSLASVVTLAVETVAPAMREARHVLTVHHPEQDIIVLGDGARLQQVLVNLLGNSIKYTSPGGRIDVRLSSDAIEARIEVVDTGDGIPPGALGTIFEMFTRVDAERNLGRSGLGIGLALARRIAELHGGSLRAHSDGLGLGSRFTLTIPHTVAAGATADAATDAIGSVSRHDAAQVEPGRLATRRVLIVDDNRDAAHSLGQLLRLHGAAVECASSGLDALHIGAGMEPHVVFLDIGMPDLDGWETARRMRQTAWGRPARLIALSGWAQREDQEQSRAVGFDHHHAKPIDPELAVRLCADADADARLTTEP